MLIELGKFYFNLYAAKNCFNTYIKNLLYTNVGIEKYLIWLFFLFFLKIMNEIVV